MMQRGQKADETLGASAMSMPTNNNEWQAYLAPLLSAVDRLLPQIPQAQDAWRRHELYQQLLSQMVAGYLGSTFTDPRYPDLWPMCTPATAYAGGNPDHDYYLTAVEDSGVYQISGFRGTVMRQDLQIGTGTFFSRGVQDETRLGLTLANHDFDSITHSEGGAYEVILSRDRPAGHSGNWWPLPKGATYLLLRQTSYDWFKECDGRIAIERLDVGAAKPRPNLATLQNNLQQIALWAESWMQLSLDFVAQIRRDQGINRIGYKDLKEYGELLTQKYAYGGFELEADEALLVEASLPEQCRYWSIHLMDDHGFTMDWVNRHTHLNGSMAVVGEDRVFRGVISAVDPGVPNWLDTMGYRNGTIQVRWEHCNRFPEHRVTKIKLADVHQHLPVDTPAISLEERDRIIRQRRKGAQWRKRW